MYQGFGEGCQDASSTSGEIGGAKGACAHHCREYLGSVQPNGHEGAGDAELAQHPYTYAQPPHISTV